MGSGLESCHDLYIQHPGSQIIWNCIQAVGDIGDPNIGDGIVHLEQVEDFGSDPDILEVIEDIAPVAAYASFDELLAKADIHPAVWGDTESVGITWCTRGAKGQATTKQQVQVHFIGWIPGKVILKEQSKIDPLVGWPGNIARLDADAGIIDIEVIRDILPGLHDGKAGPGFNATHKLPINPDIQTCSVALCVVFGIIPYPDIVDLIWNQVIQQLIVNLGYQFEGTVPCHKIIIGTGNEMNGGLGFNITVDFPRCIAQLPVKWWLMVKPGRQTEQVFFLPGRTIGEGGSWAQHCLSVEIPVMGAQPGGQGSLMSIAAKIPGMLHKARVACGYEFDLLPDKSIQHQILRDTAVAQVVWGVRQAVSC